MWGRQSGREARPRPRLNPAIEGLDARALPSGGGAGPSLGLYQAPATASPRVSSPPTIVNPQKTLSAFLASQLGPGLDRVQQLTQQGAGQNNLVASQVMAQSFVHAVLSRQDTYTLLGSALADAGNSSLSGAYGATGPVLADALRTGSPHAGPNAPRTIPGLRLVAAMGRDHNFPGSQTGALLRAFRVAVDRQVFTLSPRQAGLVADGIARFQTRVAALNQAGVFRPTTPTPPPTLVKGPLSGTLGVSLGAVRQLNSVDPALSGLGLPGIGNFQGRIDVGYVFDRAGNFGIALTARGPLSGAPKDVTSADTIGGDLRVEVTNAPNLTTLNGMRTVEGLTQGAALSGALQAYSSDNGVSSFAASSGYGSGLEFGTGKAYTQVIPLGNVYALIPEFPKH